MKDLKELQEIFGDEFNSLTPRIQFEITNIIVCIKLTQEYISYEFIRDAITNAQYDNANNCLERIKDLWIKELL